MKKRLIAYRTKIIFLVVGICLSTLPTWNVKAVNTQIKTDNTLSGVSALNIDTPGANQIYTLSEINGKTAGNNLFFSFSNFNIGTTDTAWFNLNSPDLANVISRITGGAESLIDGQLTMTNVDSTPSFFIINPAGITFGAGASVDVPGAFYTSTASKLNMSDGNVYAANETQTSTLSAATPESFGFLGDESGSINIIGLETDITELTFKPGTDVTYVGNHIQIDHATFTNTDFIQNDSDLQFIATGTEAINIHLDKIPSQATKGNFSIQNAKLEVSGHIVTRSEHFSAMNSNLFVSNFAGAPISDGQGIDVHARSLTLDNSKLFIAANSTGNSGDITVATDSLELKNSSFIASVVSENSEGNSGDVMIRTGDLSINDSNISSVNAGKGASGNVTVHADSLEMSNVSFISSTSTGHSGAVKINANDLTIDNSSISSNIRGEGVTGNVTVSADSLSLLNGGRINTGAGILSNFKVDSGTVTIYARELIINDGIIDSTVFEGNAGDVILNADYLTINRDVNTDRGIFSRVTGNGRGNSGNIIINTKDLEINKGFISTSVDGDTGQAGSISVMTDILKIAGGNIGSDISTTAQSGSVNINARHLIIDADGSISATAFGGGNAGSITMTIGSLQIIDGFISTLTNDKGNAGNIIIQAESLILNKDGSISSDSAIAATGHGGDIVINAEQIELSSFISSNSLGKGNAGSIIVTADTLITHELGGIMTSALENSQGDAGDTTINARKVEIDAGGEGGGGGILTISAGKGDAGNVIVNAESMLLSNVGSIVSSVSENTEGDGGDITINVKELEMKFGFISSGTNGKGNAGNVTVTADTLRISDRGGIHSGSNSSENLDNHSIITGDGGLIKINVKQLAIMNGFIDSSTLGAGHAGKISITSDNISISGKVKSINDLSKTGRTGVFSGAAKGSSGQTGSVEIYSGNDVRLDNGAQISIQNDATVFDTEIGSLTPASINIHAVNLLLTNSIITANSSGNIGAGSINIQFTDQLYLDPSTISTEANDGNGGAITISGGEIVYLLDSAITTSISGQSGNGGDIVIAAKGLILDSGFIQANTAASGASGGNVNVKTSALIPSGSSLFVGGNAPFQFQPFSGLNVIQAAAPGGESGAISTATPQLNLSGMLTNLVIESFDSNTLNRNMCTVDEGSSLLQSGKGGLRTRARDFLLLPVF